MKKFRSSLQQMANLRTLVTLACLIGLQVALKLVVSIQITPTVRISLDYLIHVAASALYGPAAGIVCGALSDLLGCIVHPTGPFNPGFTLSAMMNGLIYGMVLYQSSFRWQRTLIAQAFVVVITNLFLNTLWLSLYGGKAFFVMLPARALKNLIQYPVDAALMCVLMSQLPRIAKVARLNIAGKE